MGYPLNRLDEPVLIAVSKPLLTEFGIHHRLESCDEYRSKPCYLMSRIIPSPSVPSPNATPHKMATIGRRASPDLPDSRVDSVSSTTLSLPTPSSMTGFDLWNEKKTVLVDFMSNYWFFYVASFRYLVSAVRFSARLRVVTLKTIFADWPLML